MAKHAKLAATVIAAAAWGATACAQAAPFPQPNVPPPGTICLHCAQPSVEIPIDPPAGFNAVTASDAQLALYGFPPRPDPQTDPDSYAAWKAAFERNAKRIAPRVRMTTIVHGPAKRLKTVPGTASATAAGKTSTNWSGYALTSSRNVFAATKTTVSGTLVVPTAQQAFGACAGTDFSSQWVGIDGFGSPDVLQGGIEADATCSRGITTPSYNAWIEWFPQVSMQITNFPISPGDVVKIFVWNTSPTHGHFFISDLTKNAAGGIGFSAPAGTRLKGNSVEWVMERPSVNNSLATLTNYIANPWYSAHAHVPGKPRYSPAQQQDAVINSITMLDNSGVPISAAYTSRAGKKGLTTVGPGNVQSSIAGTALWFFDEGPALGAGK